MPENETKDQIKQLETKKRAAAKISLFNAPITTTKYFTLGSFLHLWETFLYLKSHTKLVFLFAFVLVHGLVLYFTPGSHQLEVQRVEEAVLIGGWWILLGILSSVGLGTGLHTFVLYLGPFIAKVTLAASACGGINFDKYGPDQFMCPEPTTDSHATLWEILRYVQLEAFLWGAGTAIGELPPYFVARAARLAGQRSAELEEFEQELKEAKPESAISKLVTSIKKLMFSLLGNLGFFGILAFASIPNPLFDLAGITCGHFLVPFWTFFGATLIGKAVIKAHIQTIFVIVMCSDRLMQYWIETVRYLLPFMADTIQEFMNKQKAAFHRGHQSGGVPENKSIVGVLWDALLITMLMYFLLSIVNSTAQNYLVQKYEKEIESLKDKEEDGNGTEKKLN